MTCPAGEPEHPRPRSSDGPEGAGVGKESPSSLPGPRRMTPKKVHHTFERSRF